MRVDTGSRGSDSSAGHPRQARGTSLALLSASLFLACLAGATGVRADESNFTAGVDSFMGGMRKVFETGSRAPGMPANKALEQRVADLFAASGFTNGAIRFNAPVFVPGETEISLPSGDAIKVDVLHPTLLRPGNFTEPEFSTRLIYAGKGQLQDLERLNGVDLAGAVLLMDFDCGDRWLHLLRLGIKGFVFLGADNYNYTDSRDKVYNTEVAVPRFFLAKENSERVKLACAAGPVPVKVKSTPSRWKVEELRDPWVLIPGTHPQMRGEVIVFTAPLDANSVVPARAVGAQSAGNLHLLLGMLDEFKKRPPERSVMLVAINSHTDCFLGERMLAWYLLGDSAMVENVRYTIAAEMRKARLYSEMYGMLQFRPTDFDTTDMGVWLDVLWELDGMQRKRSDTAAKRATEKTVPSELWRTEIPSQEESLKRQAVCSAFLLIAVVIGYIVVRRYILPRFITHPRRGRFRAAALYGALCLAIAAPILSWRTFRPRPRPTLDFQRLERMDDVELNALCNPDVEPPLNLESFADTDLLKAIDTVVARHRKQGQLAPEHVNALAKSDAATIRTNITAVKTVFDDERLMEGWRAKLDGSTGIRLPVKKELQSEAKRSLNRLKTRMMAIAARKDVAPEERDRLIAEAKKTKEDMTKVLVLFNKIDIGIGRSRTRYRDIATNETQRTILKTYRDDVLAGFTDLREIKRKALSTESSNDGIREAVGNSRIAFVVSLDMNWNSDRIGFCSINPTLGSQLQWQSELGRLTVQISTNMTVGGTAPDIMPFVDTMTRIGGKLEDHYFLSTASPAPWFHAVASSQGLGTPAFALKNVFAADGAVFSPDDSFERLNGELMYRLHTWLLQFFRNMLASEELTTPRTLMCPPVGTAPLWSTVIRTLTLDQYSGETTPDKAIPDSLVALYQTTKTTDLQPCLVNGDVVNCYRGITDRAGHVVMYGIRENVELAPIAYQMDKDFRVVLFSIDKGQIQESKQILSNVYRQDSGTLPMFPCNEFPVYNRIDPTLLSDVPITVQKLYPMSADRQASSQKYGTHGVACVSVARSHLSKGPTGIYVWRKEADLEPERLLLLTDNNRCVLNATEEKPEGSGFRTAAEMGPDFFAQAALDMDVMNRHRLSAMKGVSNELVTDFLRRAEAALKRMKEAIATHCHTAYLLAAAEALGCEVKSYEQIREMNRDMLKAIVVYMALMIPFCFFLQKLLFSFTKLQHEMLAFVLMFTGTYVIFRLIHPAFRIAVNAEAIFVAFVLGAIGVFVTWVLNRRFEFEMQVLFRNATGMESDVNMATAGQTAMMIGVSNIKRRRIRTTLTTATIVLVVFTILAFSSVSKRMMPTLMRTADESPYSGFFYRWPADKMMDEETVTVLQNIFGGRAEIVIRRSLQPAQPARLERVDSPKAQGVTIEAAVGLSMEEDGFLGRLPLTHGSFFSAPDAKEIILPARAAEGLGRNISSLIGTKLRLLGQEFTLVGIVDDDRYRLTRDLDPEFSLIPLAKPDETQGKRVDDKKTAGSGALTVDTSALAMLPVETARLMGAVPFSVSIRFPDELPGQAHSDLSLWTEAERFLTTTRAKFHVGSEKPFKTSAESKRPVRAGIYYVGSSYRTSIGGIARLLIPLLIAGSIILNTMLGTVYERKHEIAVFNAVGLNPTHIFMFFLAEAFVYGVIGAVGGYLVGQVTAILLKVFGLVTTVNINFSSLMVAYAIMFTIGLVLLSTIYPAIVATRTAVPSGKRRWSMPSHEDGLHMNVLFPFIYQPRLAPGLMSYLQQYFLPYSEQSIGDLIASAPVVKKTVDEAGYPRYSLAYSIALAPFDLGVTQDVVFVNRFDQLLGSYVIEMNITRVSGQDTNWVTTNKPFMERLRKLLIRWRNVDPTQHDWFVEQGNRMFDEATAADSKAEAAMAGSGLAAQPVVTPGTHLDKI